MRYVPSAMSWTRIGERLSRTLAVKEVDRAKLAESARVSVADVTALEKGQPVKVSTAALARLARELGLPPTALWSEDPAAEIELSLHFRHASVPDFFHEDAAVAERAVLDARALDELDVLLGRQPLRTWFGPREVGAPAHEDGYARAREVRRVLAAKQVLSSEAAPIPIGFDVLGEDSLGIAVIEAKLRTGSVLALTAKDAPTNTVAIIVNSATGNTSHLRHRVDIAHELAHALFDAPAAPLSVWVDRDRDADYGHQKTAVPEDAVEQRARAFAAEFLVPREGLRELLGPPPAEQASLKAATEMVRSAQEHFLSSTELTAHHLANNSYIPKFLHEELLRAVSPLALPPVQRRQPALVRRAREAVEAGVMTAMAAREVLGLSVWAKLPWS